MMRLLEITDWGLIEELRQRHGLFILGMLDRSNPKHAAVREGLAGLSADFDDAVFRLVDLGENPSLRRILRLSRLPAVVVFMNGEERRRWQGRVEKRWVSSFLSAWLGRGSDPNPRGG